MENDSDDDHNQDEECSELNYYQAMYPCRLTQVLNPEDPRTPYAISTLDIQTNLLKTRRRRNCMRRMCRQGIGGHTWPSQVNHPWIDQILYRIMECWTTLSIVPLNLMIQVVLMWMEMRRNRMWQRARWQRARRQRNNHSSVPELLKSSSQSHA